MWWTLLPLPMELLVRTAPNLASPLPALLTLARAAGEKLLREAGRPNAEVSLLLVDDPVIHALNREWRNVDKPTDVLSWALPSEPPGSVPNTEDVLGDVVI